MPDAVKDPDRRHLRRCLELALRGRGRVSPNPLVGAVITRGDAVVGEGWHERLGAAHAEVAALADAGRRAGPDAARGATLYVSLEPCAHRGRQPPCTDAILEAGIARVVIAADDPSAKAAGRGPRALREAGVEVAFADSPEAEEARLQNQAFRKHAVTGKPLVALKSALSLDGFTATESGDSRWISGRESRALVHRWRADADAVAVGIGTALADDPQLTARDLDPPPERQPARVVFDTTARLPVGSRLVGSVSEGPVYVVCGPEAPAPRLERLRAAGAEVLLATGAPGERIAAALLALGERDIGFMLLEGGARLAGAFAAAGELDELRLFYAPLVLGAGRPLLVGAGPELVADAQRPAAVEWQPSADDMLVRARLREW